MPSAPSRTSLDKVGDPSEQSPDGAADGSFARRPTGVTLGDGLFDQQRLDLAGRLRLEQRLIALAHPRRLDPAVAARRILKQLPFA